MSARRTAEPSDGPVRRTSIRLRILFLLCLLAVPLSLERVLSLLADRRNQIAAAEDRVRDLAQRAALAQLEGLASAKAVLDVVSRQARVLTHDPPACNRFLESLVSEVLGIQSITIVAPGGTILCAHAGGAVGLRLADRAHIAAALAAPNIVMSGLIVSQVTGRSSVYMLRADGNGGPPQSVTLVGIDQQWLSRTAARTASRPGVVVDVIGSGATILTRHPPAPDLLQRSYPDHPLTRAMLTEEDGSATLPGYDGRKRLFAFMRFEGTDMHIAVGVDAARVIGPINQNILTAGAIYLTALASFLLLTWFAAERLLIAPLTRLARGVAAVGREETDRVPDLGIREFVPLVQAFDDMAQRLSERNNELRSLNGHLAALARTDGLTELANRRTFDVQFSQDWVRARGAHTPLTVVLADVDHFKLFNDTRGHLAGDDALRAVARMLAAAAAGNDYLVARYGGEEFIILMPGAPLGQGVALAEDARQLIAALAIPHPGVPGRRLSASFGVASVSPAAGGNPDALIASADAALYDAKRRGRDRVVAAADPPGSSLQLP